jgi:hypothetical protein
VLPRTRTRTTSRRCDSRHGGLDMSIGTRGHGMDAPIRIPLLIFRGTLQRRMPARGSFCGAPAAQAAAVASPISAAGEIPGSRTCRITVGVGDWGSRTGWARYLRCGRRGGP